MIDSHHKIPRMGNNDYVNAIEYKPSGERKRRVGLSRVVEEERDRRRRGIRMESRRWRPNLVQITCKLVHLLASSLLVHQSCALTSNINSVWLTNEDAISNKSTGRTISQRVANELEPLHLGASSLLPSIVAFDPMESTSLVISDRRSDVETQISPMRGSRGGNDSNFLSNDESSLLDQLWNNIGANQTNSQVQFDEEHQSNSSEFKRPSSSKQRKRHRSDPNDTSTLTPQHAELSNYQNNNYQTNSSSQDANYVSYNSSPRKNFTEYNYNNTSSTIEKPQSFVYYLPNGDKWNPTRKQQEEDLMPTVSLDFDPQTAFKQQTKARTNNFGVRQQHHQPPSDTDQSLPVARFPHTQDASRDNLESANPERKRNRPTDLYSTTLDSPDSRRSSPEDRATLNQNTQTIATTPMPHQAPRVNRANPDHYNNNLLLTRNYNIHQVPVQQALIGQRYVEHPRKQQLYPNYRPLGYETRPPFHRTPNLRFPSESADGVRIANRRKQMSDVSNQLWLRNNHPIYYNNNRNLDRPAKKSRILGVLGNKLNFNSWAGNSPDSSRLQQSQLESSFYGNSVQMRRPQLNAYFNANLNDFGVKTRLRPIIEHPNYVIRQPTVAPAPSQALSNKFYGAIRPRVYPVDNYLTQGSHHDSQFVSSKERRQPASFIPVVAVSVTKTSPAPKIPTLQLDTDEANELNPEIDEYLTSKIGPLNKLPPDEYLASGSFRQQTRGNSNLERATSGLNDHHMTTVKSAVFGYLPHQADEPLMQAIQALNQRQLNSGSNNRLSNNLGHATLASDVYVNQVAQQQEQDQPAILPDSSYQHPEDPAPNLALQLQANSFVQNDIAHPFGDAVKVGYLAHLATNQDQLRPIEAYPSSQHQQHGFNFNFQPIQQQQLVDNLSGRYHQALMSPMWQGNAFDGLRNAPYLATSASEMNPMLFQGGQMFALPGSHPMRHNSPNAESNNDHDSGQADSDSSEDTTRVAGSSSQGLANKNRKRSGDFFANAGQILLSALPLLLAPTLGLMFASAPNPVARLHGPNPFASSSAPSSLHTGIPGAYINSLNGGSVANTGSPSQMFTPIPPFRANSSSYLQVTSTTERPAPATNRPASTTTVAPKSSTSSAPVYARQNITQEPQRVTLIVTTLSPFYNESFDTGSDNGNNHSIESHHLTRDDDMQVVNSTLLRKPFKTKSHYEVGYDGVDFDAQFPALSNKHHPIRQQSNIINYSVVQNEPSIDPLLARPSLAKDKDKRPQYSGINSSSRDRQDTVLKKRLQTSTSTSLDVFDNEEDEASSRLYPVSTWPPMRRKTVSLVTSNGNKTILDASDKYQPDIELFSSMHSPPRRAIRHSKVQLLRKKREISGSSNKLHSRKRLGKIVKRRLKRKPSEMMNSTIQESLYGSQSGRNQEVTTLDNETLSENASSKSKTAHIITTMIAQLDNQNDAGELETQMNDANEDDPSINEIREQLLRKEVAFDRLASGGQSRYKLRPSNKMSSYPDRDHEIHSLSASDARQIKEQLYPTDGGLSAGGRGRLTAPIPTPIEVISTKIKLFVDNGTQSETSRYPEQEKQANHLMQLDDARRVLANLSALLGSEKAKIRVYNNSSVATSKRRNSGGSSRQRDLSLRLSQENEESSATEMSLARTTPFPNYSYDPYAPLGYQNETSGRRDSHYNQHQGEQFLNEGELVRPIRDRVNLIENEPAYYSNALPLDERPQIGADYHSGPEQPYLHANRSTGDSYVSNNSERRTNNPYMSQNPYNYSYYGDPNRQQAYESSRLNYPPPPPPQLQPPSSYVSEGSHYAPTTYPPAYHHQTGANVYPKPRYSHQAEHISYHNDQPVDHHHPMNGYATGHFAYGSPRRPAPNYSYEARNPPRDSYYTPPQRHQPLASRPLESVVAHPPSASSLLNQGGPLATVITSNDRSSSNAVNEYLKRVQFSDSDRDKLMASYLTCDGLLNDSDHCLERLSCEFSDPQNIEKANKLDRAVSSILLGHILINTYIPNQFKLRLKSASLFGYTQSGKCSRYACNKLAKSSATKSGEL